MLARIRKSIEENDEGFTLIELLVVIIIIGILAAIAIPVFLNQRKKGYDAGVKSDLRNAATAEETYLTDYNVYTNSVTTLAPKVSTGDTLTIKADGGKGYCITGSNSNSGNTFFYDSQNGGLQPLAASYTCSDASAS